MGMFDTVYHQDRHMNEIEIQIKCAECIQREYVLEDEIDIPDGIYFGYEDEGCFVVLNKKIIAIFSANEPILFNKHGGRIPYSVIAQI